jgi:hypothetical protein
MVVGTDIHLHIVGDRSSSAGQKNTRDTQLFLLLELLAKGKTISIKTRREDTGVSNVIPPLQSIELDRKSFEKKRRRS